MDDTTRAALAAARAVLADQPDVDHDHRGPGPCPRCGGLPAEEAPLLSWHPHDHHRPALRVVRDEENE